MVGVILAAGDGKRLKNSGNEDCCKPLIKTNRKRLIEYALDNLIELDVTEAYIVVGKEGDLIKSILGNAYNGLKIFYVIQQERKGLINAFAQAVDHICYNGPVILQLSDEIFIDLKTEQIKKHIKTKAYDFYCGITYEDNPEKIKSNFSVEVDDKGVVKECTEKPDKVINNIKGTGFCVFNTVALQTLRENNTSDVESLYDLCDYINNLVKNNMKGLALHIAEKEFNVNTFADLFEAQNYLDSYRYND